MKHLVYETTIDAPAKKVWQTLWGKETYTDWTTPFCEGSYMETTGLEEGNKVRFLSPAKDGMVSIVNKKIENKFISFRHIGEVNKGVEDTESEKVKQWAGAEENYTLTETGGKTDLKIDIDITEEYAGYMEEAWPKALAALKNIAEGHTQPA